MYHHELRFGRITNVPQHLTHPAKTEIARAIPAAHHGRCMIPIEGTGLELFAEETTIADGNAWFFVAAHSPLAGGKVAVGTQLYAATVACQLATAPIAWRHVVSRYIAAMAKAAPLCTFSAPGPMPRNMPWMSGFPSSEYLRLSAEERNTVLTIVRLVGLALLEKCTAASERAKANGGDFVPNSDQYLELLDWAD
jgi:hypothetical protein